MESRRMAFARQSASAHDPGAGIVGHPFGPRQVRAELHVREAAVMLDRGRAPRTHHPVDERARVGRPEDEPEENEKRNEPAHRPVYASGAPCAQITTAPMVRKR